MAKGSVTEKSLRVGQTVYVVVDGCLGDCEIFEVIERYIRNKDHIGTLKEVLNFGYLFYSKPKAKTKMNKLNEGRKGVL